MKYHQRRIAEGVSHYCVPTLPKLTAADLAASIFDLEYWHPKEIHPDDLVAITRFFVLALDMDQADVLGGIRLAAAGVDPGTMRLSSCRPRPEVTPQSLEAVLLIEDADEKIERQRVFASRQQDRQPESESFAENH